MSKKLVVFAPGLVVSSFGLVVSMQTYVPRSYLNDYLTVKLNMPPVASIDLRPAVVKFIKRKDRCPQPNFNMSVFKKQEFFSGFLNEATTESDHHPKMNLKPKF